GAPVAWEPAGGDRVPFVSGVVLVHEEEAVALADCRYTGAGPTEQAEVAGPIGESLDPNLGRQRAVRKCSYVDDRRRSAAVDVVLGQVTVRYDAPPIDWGGERVDAGGIARCDEEQSDAHVLVPGDVVGRIGGCDAEGVSPADAHAPVGAARGQSEVPRDRACRLVVVRLRPEDPDGVRRRAGRGGEARPRAACVGDVECLVAAGAPGGRCGA